MEGRGLSDLYRNTSEEIFLRSYMENSIGVSVPTTTTMDVLSFKNLSQTFRADSEELFKSWLTNGENNCYNSPSLVHRTTRQASRRISSEIANFAAQQTPNRKGNENSFGHQSTAVVEDNDIPINANLPSVRNVIESSDLYLAKAWFNSPQPMTRSRSSELRRRYVAMQTAQAHSGYESLQHNASDDTNQDYANPNAFDIAFTSPIAEMDRVSSLVSMLKGTLEQKKLHGHIDKDVPQDPSNQGFENPSSLQESDRVALQMIEESLDHDLEEFVNSANPVQSTRASQEPSQSESSAAAPVLSSGFDACDGPSDSGHAISVSENESKKQIRNKSSNSKNGSRAKDIRERIIGSLKEERKRGNLHRHGSVTSSISGDKEDATKKRRVERSRKMAEAKERNLSPAIPSDMQSVLKRCETLEKEVRSLKLNLSFMNRKDSEQTKQIEELQKQNEELHEEKECLIEEINKFIQ